MRFKVIRAHTRGGKFYTPGAHVTAEPDEVKRQVASGALEAFGSKPAPKGKPEDAAKE